MSSQLGSFILGSQALGDPPPPNPGTVAGFAYTPAANLKPVWSWAVGPWRNGVPNYELPSMSGRHLTLKLYDPSEASFTLLGDSDDVFNVEEMVSDLWIKRDGVTLFRGRVTGSSHACSPESYTVGYSAQDYRAMLNRRIVITKNNNLQLPSGTISVGYISFAWNIPPETIAWSLITHAQAQIGMDLGITQGTWPVTNIPPPVDTTQVFRYEDGAYIWPAIQALTNASVYPGFDLWIDENLKANIAYPERGSDKGAVLDFGGTLTSFNRNFTSDSYANFGRQSGVTGVGVTGASYSIGASDLATRPEGGWATAYPSVVGSSDADTIRVMTRRFNESTAGTTNSLGPGALLNPAWNAVLAEGAWRGTDHIGPGDYPLLVIKRGALLVNEHVRVTEISIDVDQNDNETVSLSLGWPNNPTDALRKLARTVSYLNTR
jgi:hypothetical protein